jgi:uncharacterized protein
MTPSLFSGPPGYRARSPWRPWLALAATVLIVVAALIVSALVSSTLARHLGSSAASNVIVMLAALLSWQAVTVLGTLLASRVKESAVPETLALTPPARGLADYAASLVLVLTALALFNLMLWGVFGHDITTDLKTFAEPVRSDYWILALLTVGIGAPVAEELLFRGFLLSALAQTRLGFSGAALVSNTIWTLLHAGYTPVGILEVFAIGALFSWIVWRTGSIRVTIFCHALYNCALVLALRFLPLPV